MATCLIMMAMLPDKIVALNANSIMAATMAMLPDKAVCTFLGRCEQHHGDYVVPIPVEGEGEWRREIGDECLPSASRLPEGYHCSDCTSGSVQLLVPSHCLPCLHHSWSFSHHSTNRTHVLSQVQVHTV